MSNPLPSINSRRFFSTGLVLLTMAGLALRLFRLANQSLWIDEVSSIMVAQGPLHGIYERSVLASNSFPTYFVLLKLFIGSAAGDLEFRARLLSAIVGALSVPVFAGVVYLWRRKHATALLAGTLLAVNPLHLWYSQEVRGYAVMLLFGLLTLLWFELARDRRRPAWWILYLLSALLTIALHKTGFIFAAACILWQTWDVYKGRERVNSLLVHVPVVVAILVALAVKSHPPAAGYSRSANGMEIGYTFLTFLGGYSFGPAITDIQSFGPFTAMARNSVETGILLLVLLSLACLVIANLRQLISGREIQLLCLGVGLVSIAALLSGFPYNVRYALPGSFGFLALVAVLTVDSKNSIWAWSSFVAVLLVSLCADIQWFYAPQYRKDDCRAAAEWMVQNEERVHSWSVLPTYMEVPIEWYLHNSPDVLSRKVPPSGDRSTTFPPVPDVLILSRRHHLANPDQLIAQYASAAGHIQTNLAFTGFEIYVADRTAR